MKCSCPYPNNEMELQWVCEKCGERKGLGSDLDAWKGFLDGQGVEWRIEDAKYLVDLAIKDFYGEWIVIARFNLDGSLYRGKE